MGPELRRRRKAVAGHAVRHEAHLAGEIRVSDHHGLVHRRMALESRLDLAGLHPGPTYLHLVVDSPQKLEVPVMAQAHPVASSEQARVRLGAEGVGYEGFSREVRLAEVAPGHPDAAQVELPDLPDGHGPHQGVQHAGGDVVDGATDRQPFDRFAPRFMAGGHDARLGRPVGVQPSHAVAPHGEPRRVNPGRFLLAAHDDKAQAGG